LSAHGSVDHIGIEVGDLDAVTTFLADAFGLAVDREVTVPGLLRAAFLRWGDVTIELVERVGKRPPAGLDHLAIRVPDLETEVARLHAAGVVTETAETQELGGRRTIFVDGAAHGIRLQIVGT
jgi:catechol 2,3-dioxygenase-like lactoylglutathione lyase family enzyme